MSEIKIDETLVKHIASLARLSISDAEIKDYKKNFSDTIEYIKTLNGVNTEGVKPLFNPVSENRSVYAKVYDVERKERADKVENSLAVEAVLQNAPSSAKSAI